MAALDQPRRQVREVVTVHRGEQVPPRYTIEMKQFTLIDFRSLVKVSFTRMIQQTYFCSCFTSRIVPTNKLRISHDYNAFDPIDSPAFYRLRATTWRDARLRLAGRANSSMGT